MQLGKLKIKKLLKKYSPPAVLKKAIKQGPLIPLPGIIGPGLPIKKLPAPSALLKKRPKMAVTAPATLPAEPVNTVAPLPIPAPSWNESPPTWYQPPAAAPMPAPSSQWGSDVYQETDFLIPAEERAPLEPLPPVAEETAMDTGYMDTAPEMLDMEQFIEDEPEYYEGDFGGLSDAAAQQTSNAAQTAQPWYATFLTQALSVYQQEQLRKENSKRARAGLPPLSVEEFKQTLPAAQVEVGMTPEIKRMLTYGGLAIVAAIALPALLRRR